MLSSKAVGVTRTSSSHHFQHASFLHWLLIDSLKILNTQSTNANRGSLLAVHRSYCRSFCFHVHCMSLCVHSACNFVLKTEGKCTWRDHRGRDLMNTWQQAKHTKLHSYPLLTCKRETLTALISQFLCPQYPTVGFMLKASNIVRLAN